MKLDELPTPALLIDLERLERNLDRMAARARELGVALRPHAKTHKCAEIARMQTERGARGLTVSTLGEARAFVDAGFTDLTWAFPLVPGRLDEARELAARATLRLTIDSREALAHLEQAGHPFHVWLEVDCGDHRSGVDPGAPETVELARALSGSRTLVFDGLLTHAGHGYAARTPGQLAAVAGEERDVPVGLADRLRSLGIAVPGVSVGSTPTMSVVRDLRGVSEMRPGNYVFHDLTQCAIGSCGVGDIALSVLATVVSCQPRSDHAVVDAGALAMSKDPGDEGGSWGRLFTSPGSDALDPDLRLVALTQEHGKLSHPLPVGSRVRIAPNHSCLTAAQFDRYHVVRGETVVDTWLIHRLR